MATKKRAPRGELGHLAGLLALTLPHNVGRAQPARFVSGRLAVPLDRSGTAARAASAEVGEEGGEADAAAGAGRTRAALLLILLGAAVLRLWAVGLGHPFVSFQPDEDTNVLQALRLARGELNPQYFYYPTLLWYLLAAIYRLVFWIGRELGLFTGWNNLALLDQNSPVLFYLGRVLAVVFGTATVGCLYLLGRRAFSPTHGLLAASFLAGAFLHVRDSALGTTEAPLTFFVVLALLGAVGVYRQGRVRDYGLAGLAAGLATATKYNAVLVLVALGAAHVLRRLDAGIPVLRALGERRLVGAGLLAGVAFVALNPFLLLDWREAWANADTWGSLAWEWHYLHTVEYLDLRPVWWYHLSVSLRYGMGVALLALAVGGLWLALRRRDAVSLVLLSFTLTFFVAMASLQAAFVRYMTPLVPVLCLFAVATLLSVTRRLPWSRSRPWGIVGLAALALVEPVHASVAYARMTHHVDTRIEAIEYMGTALQPGSLVATYGPSVTWRSTIPRWLPEMYAKQPAQSWAEALSVLKSRDIRYLLLHRSTLGVFSPAMPDLDRALAQSATLVREFSPYKRGAHPAPVYDRNDAYYFPIGGFRGIVRPGPLVRLYRLD